MDPFKNYFNDNFNFNNQIKPEYTKSKRQLVQELQNFSCDGDIMLEPRLQEYLNKKKYYENNNIKPDVTLEMEFQITKDDIKMIRSLMKGKTNIYDKKNNPLNKKKYKRHKLKKLKKDSRVPKIKKIDRHVPKNMGMFGPDKHNDGYFYEVMSRAPNGPLDTRDMLEKSNNIQFGEIHIDNNGIDKNTVNKYHKKRRQTMDKRNKYIISDLGPAQHMSMYPGTTPLKYYDNNEFTKASLNLGQHNNPINNIPRSKPKFEGDQWNLPYPDERKKQQKQWNPYMVDNLNEEFPFYYLILILE